MTYYFEVLSAGALVLKHTVRHLALATTMFIGVQGAVAVAQTATVTKGGSASIGTGTINGVAGQPIVLTPWGLMPLVSNVPSGLLKGNAGVPTTAVPGTDYLTPSGGSLTGSLASISTISTQINASCNPLSGAQATDGTQSYVISCYGVWMGNSPNAFSIAPTRGVTYLGNGTPTPNFMNTGFLVQSWADGNQVNNYNGMALNFQTIGGSVSGQVGSQDNAVGFFESVRQAPSSTGQKAPNTWVNNWDFHIAPGAGNVISFGLEGDLNNFNKTCGVGAGCIAVWEWFNGTSGYANTAQMYGGGAAVVTFSGQATTSGNTLTVTSFNGANFTTDLTWIQVSGSTTATAASTTTNVTVASPTGIYANQTVAGTGVPSGTTVVGVSGSTITLSQAVNVASAAPLTFTGKFSARYVSATTATTFRTMPTNSTAVAFTGSISQSHFGWFENGWEQILEADARLADAAYWGIQLYGDHKIGFDTTYDLTSLAFNAAAGQSVCFNNNDYCFVYGGGFFSLLQGGQVNWFVDGQGGQHAFGLYSGAGGMSTKGHFYGSGSAPGISASAGTPTLSAGANDNAGTVTNGSTAGATVTLTWASPRVNPPDCITQNIGTGTLTRTPPTTGGFQLTFSAAGGQATYNCQGQ